MADDTAPSLRAIRRWLRPALIAAILLPTSVLAVEGSHLNQEFLDRAAAGDLNAVRVLSAGRTDERRAELASALRREQESNSDPVRLRRMRKSLASLNDMQARQGILEDLGSKDLFTQQSAFSHAADLGGNDMVTAVAAMLWDPSPGGRPRGPDGVVHTDVGIAAPRHMAVIALSKLITEADAPRIDLERIRYRDEDVERWRIWWAANKSKYLAAP